MNGYAGSDADLDALTYSIVNQPAQGTVTITNAATGAYTYTPNVLTYGADSFTFKVNDGTADSTIATVSITVVHVNHAPVAQSLTVSTLDSKAFSGTLQATDIDGDALSFKVVVNGNKGVAEITNSATGAFTYTPSGIAAGTDTFTFAANDGAVDSAPATVTVTLLPTPASFTSAAVTSGNARENFQFALTAIGTAPIQFSASALPPGLTLNGTTISGIPTAAGSYAVQVMASNDAGGTSQQLTITIINTGDAGNVPPKIVSGPTASISAAVVGNTVTFTAVATDANGDQLIYAWDFGDGSTGSGASVAHVYASSGAYVVTLNLSDGAASVSSIMLIAVNDASVPAGSTLPLRKGKISFNFAPGHSNDAAQVSGNVPVDMGSSCAGTLVTVWLGNQAFQFSLHKTGKSGSPTESITFLKIKKGVFASNTAAFVFSIRKQSLFEPLKDFGFTNTNVPSPGNTVTLPIAMTIGGKSYTANLMLMYTAKAGKSGIGKTK